MRSASWPFRWDHTCDRAVPTAVIHDWLVVKDWHKTLRLSMHDSERVSCKAKLHLWVTVTLHITKTLMWAQLELHAFVIAAQDWDQRRALRQRRDHGQLTIGPGLGAMMEMRSLPRRDGGLPLRITWILPSSGILHSAGLLSADVSGQPISPIFKGQVSK
jgi:hypothetical protein